MKALGRMDSAWLQPLLPVVELSTQQSHRRALLQVRGIDLEGVDGGEAPDGLATLTSTIPAELCRYAVPMDAVLGGPEGRVTQLGTGWTGETTMVRERRSVGLAGIGCLLFSRDRQC